MHYDLLWPLSLADAFHDGRPRGLFGYGGLPPAMATCRVLQQKPRYAAASSLGDVQVHYDTASQWFRRWRWHSTPPRAMHPWSYALSKRRLTQLSTCRTCYTVPCAFVSSGNRSTRKPEGARIGADRADRASRAQQRRAPRVTAVTAVTAVLPSL